MDKTIKQVTVEQLVNDKGNKVMNHFIIHTPEGKYLQSYDSIIAFEDLEGNITLGVDWDYSKTTREYRNQWLGMTSKELKEKIENGTIKIDNNLL